MELTQPVLRLWPGFATSGEDSECDRGSWTESCNGPWSKVVDASLHYVDQGELATKHDTLQPNGSDDAKGLERGETSGEHVACGQE